MNITQVPKNGIDQKPGNNLITMATRTAKKIIAVMDPPSWEEIKRDLKKMGLFTMFIAAMNGVFNTTAKEGNAVIKKKQEEKKEKPNNNGIKGPQMKTDTIQFNHNGSPSA